MIHKHVITKKEANYKGEVSRCVHITIVRLDYKSQILSADGARIHIVFFFQQLAF